VRRFRPGGDDGNSEENATTTQVTRVRTLVRVRSVTALQNSICSAGHWLRLLSSRLQEVIGLSATQYPFGATAGLSQEEVPSQRSPWQVSVGLGGESAN